MVTSFKFLDSKLAKQILGIHSPGRASCPVSSTDMFAFCAPFARDRIAASRIEDLSFQQVMHVKHDTLNCVLHAVAAAALGGEV